MRRRIPNIDTLIIFGENYCLPAKKKGHDAIRNSIKHSGDLIYMNSNSGQHIINMKLSKLPKLVTDIVFALSAYNCGILNLFKKPNTVVKWVESIA